MRADIGLVALGLLSACGPAADPAPTAHNTTASSPTDSALQDAAPTEPAAPTIPERFYGVWDYVEGTCARESDLRLDISATKIGYYEAIGTVTAVETRSEKSVLVTLAMEGEGETWEAQEELTLQDVEPHGEVLIVWPYENGSAVLLEVPPFSLKRCPQ